MRFLTLEKYLRVSRIIHQNLPTITYFSVHTRIIHIVKFLLSFHTTILYTVHNLFVSANHYSLVLHSGATCLNTRMTELLLDGSCYLLLEKPTATDYICAFSYKSFSHAYCCWFTCSMHLCRH